MDLDISTIFENVVGKSIDSMGIADTLVENRMELVDRLGIDQNGAIFANGKYFDANPAWTQQIIELYFDMVLHLRTKVIQSEISDDINFYDYFMSFTTVSMYRNSFLFPKTNENIDSIDFLALETLDQDLENIGFIYPKGRDEVVDITLMLISDFQTQKGLEFALNVLENVKLEMKLRLVFLDLNSVESEMNIMPEISVPYMVDVLKKQLAEKDFKLSVKKSNILEFIKGKYELDSEKQYMVINGRFIGPLETLPSYSLFPRLLGFEYDLRIKPISELLRLRFKQDWRTVSNIIFKATSLAANIKNQSKVERISNEIFKPFREMKTYLLLM
jgi:hypothetical protein